MRRRGLEAIAGARNPASPLLAIVGVRGKEKIVDYMVHLSELPLGDLIYPYLSMQSLAAIERTNKAAWVLSRWGNFCPF